MEVIVGKLKKYGVIYNREATSLSKFVLLKSREAFRQNPPHRLPVCTPAYVYASIFLQQVKFHILALSLSKEYQFFSHFNLPPPPTTIQFSANVDLTQKLEMIIWCIT